MTLLTEQVLTGSVAGVAPAADPGGSGAHGLVERAVAAASLELDDAVAEMVGEVVDHVPEYGVISPEARKDFVLGVRTLTQLALRVLGGGTPVSDLEVDAARCIGESRSQQGLSLQSVEDSVRTCFRVGLRRLCTQLRRQGSDPWLGAAFEEVTENLLSLEHQFVRGLRAGFRHSEERKARARLNREQALLSALLLGTCDDEQQLVRGLEEMGYRLRGQQLVVLVAAADVDAATRAATAFVGAFDRARQVVLLSGQQPVVAMLVPDVNTTEVARIRQWLSGMTDPVSAVVLPLASGARQVAEQVAAYQGAAAVACQLGRVGVVDPLELAPYEVLTQDAAAARRFLGATLGPVLKWKSSRREAVLTTMQAFLRHGAIKRVAHEVGVSPQTVYNHLRAVEEATGLSVLKYQAHWHLALLLLDLYGEA